jgi:predicted nucleic acid-binding protein
MTLFFPDINVWLALTDVEHAHNAVASQWLEQLPGGSTLIFSRFTQLGLLRLLTNTAAMGDEALTLRQAWGVYDRWLQDPRVEFYPEPRNIDSAFRDVTEPFATEAATKWMENAGYWPMPRRAMRGWLRLTRRSTTSRENRGTKQRSLAESAKTG